MTFASSELKDTIRAAENVIQALQNSKKIDSDVVSVLNGPCYKFGVLFVDAFMEFYTAAYNEILGTLFLNEGKVPEWLMDALKISKQESRKKANGCLLYTS